MFFETEFIELSISNIVNEIKGPRKNHIVFSQKLRRKCVVAFYGISDHKWHLLAVFSIPTDGVHTMCIAFSKHN